MLLFSSHYSNDKAQIGRRLPPLPRKLTAGRPRETLILDSESEDETVVERDDKKEHDVKEPDNPFLEQRPVMEQISLEKPKKPMKPLQKPAKKVQGSQYNSLKHDYDKVKSHINKSIYNQNLNTRRIETDKKAKSIWQSIIQKYSQYDEEDQGDIINLSNFEIELDTGHIEELKSTDNSKIWSEEIDKKEELDEVDASIDPISILTPTRIPTRIPTRAPTRAPTRPPTRAPTRPPTRLPTRSSSPARAFPYTPPRLHPSITIPIPSDSALLLTPPRLTPKPTPRSFSKLIARPTPKSINPGFEQREISTSLLYSPRYNRVLPSGSPKDRRHQSNIHSQTTRNSSSSQTRSTPTTQETSKAYALAKYYHEPLNPVQETPKRSLLHSKKTPMIESRDPLYLLSPPSSKRRKTHSSSSSLNPNYRSEVATPTKGNRPRSRFDNESRDSYKDSDLVSFNNRDHVFKRPYD